MNSKGAFPSLRWNDTTQALFQQSREQHRQQKSAAAKFHLCMYSQPETGYRCYSLENWFAGGWTDSSPKGIESAVFWESSLQQRSPAALTAKEDLSFQAPAPGFTAWKSRSGRSETGSRQLLFSTPPRIPSQTFSWTLENLPCKSPAIWN